MKLLRIDRVIADGMALNPTAQVVAASPSGRLSEFRGRFARRGSTGSRLSRPREDGAVGGLCDSLPAARGAGPI